MILVKNKKDCPVGEYIGRGSPLGNPYDWRDSKHPDVKFKVASREIAISEYSDYLVTKLNDGDPIICDAINRLIIKHFKGETVNLLCYCKPEACHGDAIKEIVESKKYCINWFSNMRRFEKPIVSKGVEYWTPENFFQAMKSLDLKERAKIAKMDPYKSKRYARTIELRPDWEDVKLRVMRWALEHKFKSGIWADRLNSYKGDIIEFNNWGDRFWGVDIFTGDGENRLGKLLMEIRNENTY